MNKKFNKWTTIIVMLAFSWIFIGSLIQFHLDRIQERDTGNTNWSFIKPKPKDEQSLFASYCDLDFSVTNTNINSPAPYQHYYSSFQAGDFCIIEKILGPDHGMRAPPLL